MAGLTILFALIVSAVVCLAIPNDYRNMVDQAVVRGQRAMTLEEVVDFVKRSNNDYMAFPVESVEMAKRVVQEAFEAHAVLQKQKKFSDCTELQCHTVTMGGKDYVQCVRVPANCQK